MRRWPRRRIFAIVAVILVVVGIAPLTWLLWHNLTHNFRPLSMSFPLTRGEHTSPEFKTDLDEAYVVQIELMDSTNRAIGLNPNAVLDLDWKIVDIHGVVAAQGAQNAPLLGANNVNLGEYRPKRGLPQKMIINLHRDFDEPVDSKVTLEINSTEDSEGAAFGFALFSLWAEVVGGAGALICLGLLIERAIHRARAVSAIP
jgi:hypothetical protein